MATPVNPCGSGIMYYIKPYFDSETEIISTVNMYKVRRYDEDITKCLVSKPVIKGSDMYSNVYIILYITIV